MNRAYPLFLVSFILLITSCKKDNSESNIAGLVTFAEYPSYSSGAVKFKISVQFGQVGHKVNCDYQLLDGSTLVASGSGECLNNNDGLGIFWESVILSIPINYSQYSGKTLTLKLDPDNKITLSTYTSETYVNLYKVASIIIP